MTDLHVIGAGLGRTGTSSLKLALEHLGLGPVHHMSVAMTQPPEVVRLWKRVARGTTVEKEAALKTILGGFKSVLDYPSCTHFATLLAWNPGSKVILTVRDTPEQWAGSARSTIFSTSPTRRLLLHIYFSLPWSRLYYLQFMQESSFSAHPTNPLEEGCDLAGLYSEWNNHVINTTPPERLVKTFVVVH